MDILQISESIVLFTLQSLQHIQVHFIKYSSASVLPDRLKFYSKNWAKYEDAIERLLKDNEMYSHKSFSLCIIF
jgi:hypothetical protein